jgi:transposase
MRVAAEIALSAEEHRKLEKWASTRSTSVRLRERARIVLMAAQGMTNKAIAAQLGGDANKVGRWRSRVGKEGMSSIEKERPRGANHGGKNSKKQAELRSRVIEATTQTTPKDATHWSCRSMARHVNTTHSFVNRVWRAHGLKAHLIRTFKLSNDPRFEEKLRDVVGLYLDPPHNAAVFSFDEKSQIQALDRTQPGLPMKKGRCATMTHHYKRHGTTTLFAASNMVTDELIGKTCRKHRHQEVLRFLCEIENSVPKEQEIHIVLDNYATHKHEKVLTWIERKKRIFLHFIPTSAPWVNLVERFFAILTQNQIRRGVFTSVPHLDKCLREYLHSYNENPRPLVWKQAVEEILEKIRRNRPALSKTSQLLFC